MHERAFLYVWINCLGPISIPRRICTQTTDAQARKIVFLFNSAQNRNFMRRNICDTADAQNFLFIHFLFSAHFEQTRREFPSFLILENNVVYEEKLNFCSDCLERQTETGISGSNLVEHLGKPRHWDLVWNWGLKIGGPICVIIFANDFSSVVFLDPDLEFWGPDIILDIIECRKSR